MKTDSYLSRTLKDLLAAGEPIGLLWLALGSPSIAEFAAHSDAGALVIDLQHGLWDRHSLEAAVGVTAPRLPVIVRVAENSPAVIGNALDAGADSVLVPLVDTVEQARAAVAAARFPPRGNRSGGGIRPLAAGFADYMKRSEAITVGVMIETATAVSNADAIAAVDGLDYVLIGSGDLSISYAATGGDAAEVEAGCRLVHAACRKAGLPCGIFTPNLAKAISRRDEGYDLVVLANDVDALNDAFAASTAAFGKRA